MRKWPLKKKNNISTSFEQTFKIAKNPGKIQQNNVKNKYNFERASLAQKCCFDENKKITHFFTFLDKMQFSAILCLATYDWFCADGSHIVCFYNGNNFQ